MPVRQTRNKTKSRVPKTRKTRGTSPKRDNRLVAITEIITDTGYDDPADIAEELKKRKIPVPKPAQLYQDIKSVRDKDLRWAQALAKTGWMRWVNETMRAVNAECKAIAGDITFLRKTTHENPAQHADFIAKALEEIERPELAEAVRNMAAATTITVMSRAIALLDARLTDKRSSVVNLATETPLYTRLMQAEENSLERAAT